MVTAVREQACCRGIEGGIGMWMKRRIDNEMPAGAKFRE